MDKRTISTYYLIIAFGVAVITSFFSFRIGNFDWTFFAIIMSYIVISSVLEFFAVSAFVNRNASVIAARLLINDSFERIETKGLWDNYKKQFIDEHRINTFYNSYCIYYFKNLTLAFKRDNSKLTPEEFKKSFLAKNLKNDMRGEKLCFIKKIRIIKLQNDQDNVNYIDKERIKYKRGYYLGKPSIDYIKTIISVIFEIVSFGIAVFSLIHFSINITNELLVKLLLIVVLFIADIYWIYSNVKSEIRFWNDYAKAINDAAEVLESKKDSDIVNSLAYHVYNSIKVDNYEPERNKN